MRISDWSSHVCSSDLLIDPVLVNVVVAAPEALVVNHGEHRKADIRQHKEVADAASEGSLFLPHIVKVDDQAEHEHRSQDRPDRLRPRPRNPLDPRGGGKQPRADQEAYPEPERKRKLADAKQTAAESGRETGRERGWKYV